jgi:hypothetical protein
MVDTKLYALGATKYFKENREWIDREVLLLDFSALGDFTIKPLYDLTRSDYANNLRFDLGESATDKTILLVIGGRFILPHEFSIIDGMLRIPKYKLGLKNTIITNLIKSDSGVFNTYLLEGRESEYLDKLSTARLEHSEENFVVILDNPNIQFSQFDNIFDMVDHVDVFDRNATGLLISGYDKSILSYVNVDYDMTSLKFRTPDYNHYQLAVDNVDNVDIVIGSTKLQCMECVNENHHDELVFKPAYRQANYLLTMGTV